MVAQPQSRMAMLTEEEREFLCTFADDRERSPWMVTNDFQEMAIAALRYALQHYRTDWYASGELAIPYLRPNGAPGQVAPDIMVAFVPNHPRDVFDIGAEGGFPPFVLEVVSKESRSRDTGKNKKVRIYDLLGAQEYAIFDPRAKRRPPLAGYRRGADGGWEEWPLDASGALRSDVLGLTLVQDGMLLRLKDAYGRQLPIPEEEAALAAAARYALATAQDELAAAENRIARLEAELGRLKEEQRP